MCKFYQNQFWKINFYGNQSNSFSLFFQWIVCNSSKMRPSRNRNHLCSQIFLPGPIWSELLHGNFARNCNALSVHGFQQNCPPQGCLSEWAWNHSCARIVSRLDSKWPDKISQNFIKSQKLLISASPYRAEVYNFLYTSYKLHF